MQKKTCKHGHVGLLEITHSISEKPVSSRSEEMITKNGKRVKELEKHKKITLSMKHVEKQSDFAWEIDCTTSSNEHVLATIGRTQTSLRVALVSEVPVEL